MNGQPGKSGDMPKKLKIGFRPKAPKKSKLDKLLVQALATKPKEKF